MQKYALIVAGGKGERMNPELPKQFMILYEKPMLMHTVLAFSGCVDGIVVVIPADFTDYWNHLCKSAGFNIPHLVVTGGLRRSDSVLNGLAHIPDDCLVAIHDGARPLVSRQLIVNCFEVARIQGSAIPALPPSESVMIYQHDRYRCTDRSQVRLVQTPQVFEGKLIKSAYNKALHLNFTDDASVFEAGGGSPFLVEGEKNNIKITTPVDFGFTEMILANRKNCGMDTSS